MINLIIYLVLLLVSVYEGYKMRFLTLTGAIAAFFVGGAVSVGFGWRGFIVLGVFFITSSLWSKFKRDRKKRAEQKHAKGSTRDWTQVVANGGAAALFSLVYFQLDEQSLLLAFLIAIASANSDTWASEIGTLSRRPPLFIRTMKRTESGTSGAVSLLGSLAGLAGSFVIAAVATAIFSLTLEEMMLVFMFGFLGNLIDTILGAFFQAAYYCPVCKAATEKKQHCKEETKLVRGISILNNDVVNLLSGLLAAILYLVFY